MKKNSKIFIAGAGTLIGSAIVRQLKYQSYCNLLAEELDFADAKAINCYFAERKPDYVFVAAGNSGGIGANQRFPADLMRDNLLVACHVIHSAYCYGTRKLLYLASSCCYPKLCPQPMQVAALFTGPLERTNEAYALAKLSGIGLCRAYRSQYGVNFISAIPANVFGPGDDFSLEDSHVIGALIRRMHEAKARGRPCVEVWGSGNPRREFIFSHDLADACLFLMDHYEGDQPVNLGVGHDCSIREIAEAIREVVGYSGNIEFDQTKPDGMPAKLLESGHLRQMGWKPRTSLHEALAVTYKWFLRHGQFA